MSFNTHFIMSIRTSLFATAFSSNRAYMVLMVNDYVGHEKLLLGGIPCLLMLFAKCSIFSDFCIFFSYGAPVVEMQSVLHCLYVGVIHRVIWICFPSLLSIREFGNHFSPRTSLTLWNNHMFVMVAGETEYVLLLCYQVHLFFH
jgi:hypothetical protein